MVPPNQEPESVNLYIPSPQVNEWFRIDFCYLGVIIDIYRNKEDFPLPRTPKCRRICFTPRYDSFYPENSQTDDDPLTLDEYQGDPSG